MTMPGEFPVGPLDGFRVVKSDIMTGAKKAVRVGDTIYVSPAMFDLMSHSSEEELRHLLANIPLLNLPALNFDITTALLFPADHSRRSWFPHDLGEAGA
jgi:hypothetical protein